MMSKLNTTIGLLIIAAFGAGIYLLFREHRLADEEEGDEEEVVTEVPVQVAKIRQMTLYDYVVAYGSVIPNPGMSDEAPASVRIDSPQSAIITAAYCVAGQKVSKGQVLFTMYDQPVRLALKQKELAVSFAEQRLARQQKLVEVQGTSTRHVEEARQELDHAKNELHRAEVELKLFKVKAPFSGTIAEVRGRAGEAVSQGDILAELINLEQLLVKADVPSAEAKKLEIGQSIEIESARPAAADEKTNGLMSQIDYINFKIDTDTDTVTVLAKLPAGTPLRPGEFTRIRIVVDEHRDRLAVPRDSVLTTIDGKTAIAAVRGDEAILIPVTRGYSEGDWVEIEGEDLKPEMTVVTTGAYGLPDRTKIRIIGGQHS